MLAPMAEPKMELATRLKNVVTAAALTTELARKATEFAAQVS